VTDERDKEVIRLTRRVSRLETTLVSLEQIRDTNARLLDRLIVDLDAERARSHELLLNILPEEIVGRLTDGSTVIADRHEDVTVVFSDFVGFTAISSGLDAETLVASLNRLFTVFDEACDRFGVEKIKTIGDAYMAVAGLRVGAGPASHTSPAVAAAELAFAMLETVRAAGDPWQIRIGIHRGPVVAGVIGRRKFAYDVWGDTVNVASRLETGAEPGRIQVSASVAEALADDWRLESRGEVELKGKRPMPAFYLLGRA
jgi:class 3 adenylate cyclase